MAEAKKGANDFKVAPAEVERVARQVLEANLAFSVEHRWEYGGVICANQDGKSCVITGPFTDNLPTTVNIRHREENCGCPAGTKPVAFYHTHPTYSVGGFKANYNKIEADDIEIAKDKQLDAYVATLDGSFLKYDYRTGQTVPLGGRIKNTK